METIQIARQGDGFASTQRVDAWWIAPALTAFGLVLFFGYLTFRAFNPTYVWFDPYISPTVAPPVFTPASGYPGAVPIDHAWFGAFPAWWPTFLPQSPAFFLRHWRSPSASPATTIAVRTTKRSRMTPPSCAVRGLPFTVPRGEERCYCFRIFTATRSTAPCCYSCSSGGKLLPRSSKTAGSASVWARWSC